MLDVLIIGGGPSGIACAIAAVKAGLSARILEQGSIADAIRRFPVNMTWFSTPELLEVGDVPFVISALRPTRVDTLNYYARVVARYGLDIRCHDAVQNIHRQESGSFVVTTAGGTRHDGQAVVIATGYFDQPNRLGVAGEDLPWVRHAYDEPFSYVGNDVVVVGGRNSAVETALDLYRHGARVTLVHRGTTLSPGVKYWVLPDIENRIKAGQVRALFSTTIREFAEGKVLAVDQQGVARELPAQFAFVLIGFGPDSLLLRDAGVQLHPETLAPVCNPGTFETNVPGLYVSGSVVAGKETNTIFVENGRLHGEMIVASLKKRKRVIP